MKNRSGRDGKSGKGGKRGGRGFSHSKGLEDRREGDRRGGDDRREFDVASRVFEFTDRSGKVHTLGKKAGQKEEQEPTRDRGKDREGSRGPGRREPQRPHSHRSQPGETGISTRRIKPEKVPADRRDGELLRLRATVDKNRKGFGFLAFTNREYEDAFIPPRDAQALFHGDLVEVTISRRGEVHQIRVLQHRFREMTGRFAPHPSGVGRGGWIIYERKKAREEVFIPEIKVKVEEGDWIRAKLTFHEQGQHNVTAEILEAYGPELPPSADVGMIAAEYSLVEEHPADAEQEAREKTLEVPGRDLQGREDLRAVPFITIDGETARDFDDAVFVEREKNGFVLWVAIADVSHYVREGSALDRDARSRGTSVYFPERAFHMLPRALSENLCSLRPDEPRLTLVARMEYDNKGRRTATELMEAVIQSRRRATYNEIQNEWESNKGNPRWEFEPHFALYDLIRKSRTKRGSIDFEFPEAEILVQPTGEVISIKNRARLDAHRLIEEFMIAANESVTEWALERDWPFVYRVHDVPAQAALDKFQELAAHLGVRVSLGDGTPKAMAEVVRKISGHPAQSLLSMALLRSMKQAIYTAEHGIHFGLASEGYTHFTSPIRRYPDLVVHRLLRHAMWVEKRIEPKLDNKTRSKIQKDLEDAAEHCSYRERLASDAERDSIKLKQVRMMLKHLGDEFEGKVNGMMESGLFIQLEDPFIEGMLHKDSLTDDFYEFNEERMVFYGKRKKRTFQIGDKVRVSVMRADIDRRQIDFGLVEFKGVAVAQTDGPLPATTPSPRIEERFARDKGRERSQIGREFSSGKGPRDKRGEKSRGGGGKKKGSGGKWRKKR